MLTMVTYITLTSVQHWTPEGLNNQKWKHRNRESIEAYKLAIQNKTQTTKLAKLQQLKWDEVKEWTRSSIAYNVRNLCMRLILWSWKEAAVECSWHEMTGTCHDGWPPRSWRWDITLNDLHIGGGNVSDVSWLEAEELSFVFIQYWGTSISDILGYMSQVEMSRLAVWIMAGGGEYRECKGGSCHHYLQQYHHWSGSRLPQPFP